MSNVFLKNTTASAITVAGYTVHYIDSTDAEIVEVEGTSGQALPSVGDTVTFGNYPQATSTPEPIRWKVLEVDSVNGKAFLIAVWVLDAQQFNSTNSYVAWENCSLRTWCNSTFKNAAFNSGEQSRILLSHIENPSSGSDMGTATDDYVFCLSAPEASSYFASDSARRSAPTQHAIDAGVYYSTFARWWLRNGASYYTKPYVEPNGSVTTSSSQHVVYINGVRPAMWVSFSGVTTVRYKAFKFTYNGTPYYYVIDGTHDTWTDDLSAWGYSEVQPAPVLPTVSYIGRFIYSGGGLSAGEIGTLRDSNNNTIAYNTSVSYAVYWYASSNWGYGDVSYVSLVNDSGLLKVKNISNTYISIYFVSTYECSSNQATVVTVYDSSNVAYNVFKYTASGTDYYYVLDGTQTDWTDDLSSIGYRLPQVGYFTSSGSSASSDTSLSSLYWNYVYDASGAEIPYDSSKTYTSLRAITASGTVIDITSGYMGSMRNSQAVYVLAFKPASSISAIRIEYTVS